METQGNRAFLPPRYEIRKLEPHHVAWSLGIMTHSNLFHGDIVPNMFPERRTERLYEIMKCQSTTEESIESGLSFGVFDTEYKFKREESIATDGKLYWDDNNLDATGEELLEQMDFPLVSVGLAYDAGVGFDRSKAAPLFTALPTIARVPRALDRFDPRTEEQKKPKGPGEWVFRSGTATRGDYLKRGLAKGLAHFMMFHAAELGFKAVSIVGMSDAVGKIWMNPPAPFRATLLAEFHANEYEEEVDGKMIKPFAGKDVWCTRVWVDLV